MGRSVSARLIAFGLTGLLATSLPGIALAHSATPSPALGLLVGTDAWAYGGLRSYNVSGSGANANGSYEYTIRAYYGVEVVLAQQNLSGGIQQLSVQRTEAANFYVNYCRPNCANALVT